MTKFRTLLLPALCALVLPSALANPTVSSPGAGDVSSPFKLSADASTCSGQPVTGMGYSLDSNSNTTIFHGTTSIDTSVSASNGNHTLHVKSWGDEGASCVTDVAIEVTGSASTAAVQDAAVSAEGISVSTPDNGATVAGSFQVAATASSCSGQAIHSMAYSIDNGGLAGIISGGSLSTTASASAGAHTLHVKSWGTGGAGCVANVAITVSGSSSTSGPSIPSNATSVSSLQTLSTWKEAHDAKTDGTASGAMALVGSPTLSGTTRQFETQYTGGGGERYYASFSDDTSAENFVYDAWIYLTDSASTLANLELDTNQVMPNGQTVIFGFQCDGYSGLWDYSENTGSATSPHGNWVHSSAPCNVRNWSRNTWHHVQVSYSRNSSGDVTYHAVWLDGKEQSINGTVYSAYALGWGPTIVTNFQVDGLTSGGSSTVYLDKFTIYRW